MDHLNQLVPIQDSSFGESVEKTVSARDLHTFLNSKQDFSHWIKNRIGKYRFVKDLDFTINLSKTKNSKGGRPKTEYYITLDMAKELSMVENNEKGRQARPYFINCEKALRKAMESIPNFKEKCSIVEYADWKHINLTELEHSYLDSLCMVGVRENKLKYEELYGEKVFHIEIVRKAFRIFTEKHRSDKPIKASLPQPPTEIKELRQIIRTPLALQFPSGECI